MPPACMTTYPMQLDKKRPRDDNRCPNGLVSAGTREHVYAPGAPCANDSAGNVAAQAATGLPLQGYQSKRMPSMYLALQSRLCQTKGMFCYLMNQQASHYHVPIKPYHMPSANHLLPYSFCSWHGRHLSH